MQYLISLLRREGTTPGAKSMMSRIVAIGETLWDLLPTGRQLGGAPANFACHAYALGGSVNLVTRVGDDELGREMLRALDALGLRSATVTVDRIAPTGVARAQVNSLGQAKFIIDEDSAWDRLTVSEAALDAVAHADAVYFGTLGQRTPQARETYGTLLAHAPHHALRICDLNLRQEYFSADVLAASLARANVVKLNDDELPVLADTIDLPHDPHPFMEALADCYELSCVALTRGKRGSLLLADGQFSAHSGNTVEVRDTVGAGDAFTAALTMGLLSGLDLDEINRFANDTASEVCSHPGATPPLSDKLRRRLQGIVRQEVS